MYYKSWYAFQGDQPIPAVIRNYVEADIPALIAVQRESFPPPFPPELWWNETQLRNHVRLFPEGALCVEIGGKIVGSMTGMRVQMDEALADLPMIGADAFNALDAEGASNTTNATGAFNAAGASDAASAVEADASGAIEVAKATDAMGVSGAVDAVEAGSSLDHTWEEMTDNGYITNHRPDGNTLYVVDICIHPAYRKLKLGYWLMQSMYELVIQQGMTRLLGGGRMPGYRAYKDQWTVEQYVQAVLAGRVHDPVITFLLRCGRTPCHVVANYLEDYESCNYAVLMAWHNPFIERTGRN